MTSKRTLLLMLIATGAWAQTFDGPAELPRSVPATTFVFPNPPKAVAATDSLPAAIAAAKCGDTLNVDPASITTISGKLVLPNCTAALPMNIENAAAVVLDNITGRVVPGQPLPKIIIGNSGACVSGGAFVRLAGFEITRLSNTGIVYHLVCPGVGAHDLIFDMDYIHGTPTDETVRGLETSNAYNGAVLNSYFADFHCLAIAGACTDSQAINGGLSSQVADCNWRIQNNYLSAAGENILLGGGAATLNPCDWTITGNTLYKPDAWNPGEPFFIPVAMNAKCPNGGKCPWAVKNLFELKNAQRFLVEHNEMHGSWGGFTQTGFGILITPKNQNNQCPACLVTDVTLRFNKISHTGAAITMGVGPSDVGGWPTDGGRWSVHDNVWSDLQFPGCYACYNFLAQLSSAYTAVGAAPPPVVLHDVSFVSNSLFLAQWAPQPGSSGHGFLLLAGPPSGQPQMTNIHFDNNLVPAGSYSIFGAGGAGADCATAVSANYSLIIPNCWTGNSTFIGNVITTPGTKAGAASWPTGNYVLAVGANIN